MRVIAGSRKGHTISAPKRAPTRPTSDRVRENAFNLIGPVDGADVLDLFAGSGAMGIEALSRGAASCTFVESDREACRTINANLDKLRLNATVLCQDVLQFLATERRTYDLVILDPPYDFAGHERLAEYLPRVVTDDGLVVYETAARVEPHVDAFEIRTSRKYGAARLTLFER